MPDRNETVTPDQLARELSLPAVPKDVWNVVTSPGWLADDVRLELIPGGEASFSCEEWSKQGWVEEAIAPGGEDGDAGRLVFWWSADGEPASRVELTLEPEGENATRLRVVEARPLELLDLVGLPLPGAGGATTGTTMLVAA